MSSTDRASIGGKRGRNAGTMIDQYRSAPDAGKPMAPTQTAGISAGRGRNFLAHRVCRTLHRGGDPLLQLLLRRGADLARGHLAILEDHQRWDRLDAVLCGGGRSFVVAEVDDLHIFATGTAVFITW